LQEPWKSVLSRAEKNRVSMRRSFFRQRRYVQAAQHDERSARAIMIGDRIRAIRVRDVNLNDDQSRIVIKVELLDVLDLKTDLETRTEIRSEPIQPKPSKKR